MGFREKWGFIAHDGLVYVDSTIQGVEDFVEMRDVMTECPVDRYASELRIGECLSVEYRGVLHTVYVVPPVGSAQEAKGWWRYVYRDQRYKTLSAVARVITGDPNLSGNRFFGLRRRRRG